MSWLLINKALALVGPKTRIYYLLITPSALGIFEILKHAPKPLEVNLPVTVAFNIGLTICYAIAVSIRDLFCPDLIRGVTSQEEYIRNKTNLLRELQDFHTHQFEHAKLVTSHLQEILKIELQEQLAGLYEEEKADKIADALAKRAYKLSDNIPDLDPHSETAAQSGDVESVKSSHKLALSACATLIILGAACGAAALSFVVLALVHSIGRLFGW